jgi:hypothetical protein
MRVDRKSLAILTASAAAMNSLMPAPLRALRFPYAKDVPLLVSVELLLFRDDPDIPNSELLELATDAS